VINGRKSKPLFPILLDPIQEHSDPPTPLQIQKTLPNISNFHSFSYGKDLSSEDDLKILSIAKDRDEFLSL